MKAFDFGNVHIIAATDAKYQNRIHLRDITLNLPVVARQPHPDPSHASHTAAART